MTAAAAMAVRAFAVADCPATPWRNGGGTARTLATDPPGAPLDGFDWRVAIAEIVPGTTRFSRYPGVDRVLVATGPGLALGDAEANEPAFRAVEAWEPTPLDGDRAVDARLAGAPVAVFNVMARRGAVRGSAAVHRRSAVLPAASRSVLWCVQGRASLGPVALAAGMAAVADAELALGIEVDGTIVLAATLFDA